jgi:3-hydroxyisobutyrate dehydrogenase-like beta-hydroxyacid dehydrogenase
MGARMAERLLKAGHEVTVWNRSPEKTAPLIALGAKAAYSPSSASANAEFVVSMLRDDDASREVWLAKDTGALDAMQKTSVAIDSSTVTPMWSRELADKCASAGIQYLDAPVVGSRPQAEAGQLIYLVGGDAAAFASAEPLFLAMGKSAHYLGPAGSGALLKLVVNALLGVQVTALGELIGLLGRSHVDTKKAIEVLCATPVISPSAALAAGSMQNANFSPLFPVELIEKDMGYLLKLSNEGNAPLVEAARKVFNEAIEAGYENEQMTAVVKLYE